MEGDDYDQEQSDENEYENTLPNDYHNGQTRSNEFLIQDQAEEPDIITGNDENEGMEPIEDLSSIINTQTSNIKNRMRRPEPVDEMDYDYGTAQRGVPMSFGGQNASRIDESGDLDISVSVANKNSIGRSSSSNKYKRNKQDSVSPLGKF